jgi:tetratricopeptide (TPR) repeat protein
MHAAAVESDEGWPVLRLWEFERRREMPYQIDFILPPGSSWLFVRVRLFNPHDRTLPMYWWSNIAMPETPRTRVLAPATAAYNHAYQGGLRRVPVPVFRGRDVTYPLHVPASADFFFDIEAERAPWLTAVDGEGVGLVQTSTAAQRGRKLFVWGAGPGARQWQRLLTEGDHPYLEIQAGVARTQYESFPMAPRSNLAWMEAYGSLRADPGRVHGSDWAAACAEVEGQLERALPRVRLDKLFHDTEALADRVPAQILHRGSGWGALERRRRQRAAEMPLCPPALAFDDASLTDEQAPWLALLETGHFPEADAPGAWMVQDAWRPWLERCADDHWLIWLHRGVMRHDHGDPAGAEAAWEQSLARRRTPWALRQLAVCARQADQPERAAALWREAHELLPQLLPLAIECLDALIAAGQSSVALELAGRMPPQMAGQGRILAMRAQAALEAGFLEQAETILGQSLGIADLREGSLLLSDLWYDLQARRLAVREGSGVTDAIRQRARATAVLPAHLDYRMATDAWS